MKVYEVKYGTEVIIDDDDIIVLPDAPQLNKGDIIKILRLDGGYYSATKDKERVYIHAFTEVKLK